MVYRLSTLLSEKLMFVLNETNIFLVCCSLVDMLQGIFRLCQLIRSNVRSYNDLLSSRRAFVL